jgi:fatty-acyl-CoA synthase
MHSPTLFKGYFNNPLATKEAFTEDGFFKTGDLGYVRADGSFVYQSRMGDTMRIGGFLVDPSEIEHVLAEQPEIQSAQVVGIEIEGKLRPVAFVIKATSEEPSVPSILNNVAAQLAKFKVPARLWFVDEFPATASANGLKFQRVKLREMAVKRLSAER